MDGVYNDRTDAGKRLAKRLSHYHGSAALVLGIPRGGVPVAAIVASRLELEWNVIVTRKLPIPWNPEAGFGAVAADGTVVLNEAMVNGLQLTGQQIDEIARQVREEVGRRTEFFAVYRPPAEVAGRSIILVDDGLASGYTMLAAVKSLRARSVGSVIVASPVASRSAAALVEPVCDEYVFGAVSQAVPFAVADYYVEWHDLTDDELVPFLEASKAEPHPPRES